MAATVTKPMYGPMTKPMTRLGTALDKQSWQWLQDADEDIANAVSAEVQAGASPDAIRRFILAHVGSERTGLAARACSAARWLETQRELA